MRDVLVAGAGMTDFGKFMDRSVRSLAEEATAEALADARAAPSEVEVAFFSNATAGVLTGQEMIRGQSALRHTGVLGVPIVNVENACASASSAFWLAWMSVASGTAEVALAVGAEKLTHPDKARSFAAIGTAVDLEELGAAVRDPLARTLLAAGSPLPTAAAADPTQPGRAAGRSPFMDIYAQMTRRYMDRSGATPTDFAKVVTKNQGNGKLNPKAQYGADLTV
jgi:acetyl-CoA acetyltransferase